jgi:L-2-hydroxyglutarate oxidase LhgO
MSKEVDVVIIGAGIIGLSVARALLLSREKISVTILEKESESGCHASGRNSGVIHAGFYYSPDSLKARFCLEGNQAIKKMCKKFNIPLKEIGKVVVTTTQDDELRLENLFMRGLQNGVDLELLDGKHLTSYEPLAKTAERFIWSPTTAVSDPRLVLTCIQNEVIRLGGKLEFNQNVNFKPKKGCIESNFVDYYPKHIVNSAGAQADRIAKLFGFADGLSMVPFMGVYRRTDQISLPLQRLVYPVPNPLNPFLGVHLTISAQNDVKVGPTAIPLLNREQYTFFKKWNMRDIKESVFGAYSLLKGNSHDFPKIIQTEFPKLFRSRLVDGASHLVPSVNDVARWEKMQPGIRAQLVNLKTGMLINDFLVEGDSKSTHVLNAVSPGWTASIPFGMHVSELVLRNF